MIESIEWLVAIEGESFLPYLASVIEEKIQETYPGAELVSAHEQEFEFVWDEGEARLEVYGDGYPTQDGFKVCLDVQKVTKSWSPKVSHHTVAPDSVEFDGGYRDSSSKWN
jgi:hypothetical protein